MVTKRVLHQRRLRKILKVSLTILIIGFPIKTFGFNKRSLRPAEHWILQRVAAGEVADLSKFPRQSDRVIRAAFVKSLVTNRLSGIKLPPAGVRIWGATIVDTLDLTNEEITYPVVLRSCTFKDDVIFLFTRFKGRLELEGSSFDAPADFRYTRIDGDLAANEVRFNKRATEEVDTNGDYVDKADFSNMKVTGPIFLNGATFDRPASFYSVQSSGFEARKGHFNKAADFELLETRGHAFFTECYFEGTARFYRTKVSENFEANGAHFDETKEGATFEGLIAHSAMLTKAGPERAVFNGPVRFYGANISSNFEADDAQINSSADFSNMVINGHAFLRRTDFKSNVTFWSTTVGGSFDVSDAQFNNERSWVSFNDLKADVLGFENAVVKGTIDVSGLKFREVDAEGLANFRRITGSAIYDAGAYAQLEDYYRRRGNTDQADEIYIAQRQRERSNLWMPQRWLDALVLDFGVGYGRHTWRLIIPSLILIGIGCWVFRSRELMEPQKPEYKSRHFSRFLYSLGLFLPIVDLQSASVWMPRQDRPAARRYLPVHVIAGWILVTILVGALTGILK